ncbi:hypothetical protein [Robertmurraya sp. Marseille-Q9965]
MLVIHFIFLFILLWYSIVVKDNEVGLAVRFFVILSLLIMAYFVPKRKYLIDIFLIVTLVAALFLIGFEIYLMFQTDVYVARLRDKFIHNGWGDFYTFNGLFYKIQIKGNSTLPFAFFVSLVYFRDFFKKILVSGIIFVGVLIAGNFAFLIAVAVFIVLYYILVSLRDTSLFITRFTILVLLSLVVLIPAKSYVEVELERKQEVSLSTRGDQFIVLVDDLSESGLDVLFGRGLGNTVDVKTNFRDYTGAFYYELQTLYILNQTGILYFLLFLGISTLLCIIFWRNKYVYLIYLTYLLYAITNPYLFDTTHIIVIIVLNSLALELRKTQKQQSYETIPT